jgi:hypothetical protein
VGNFFLTEKLQVFAAVRVADFISANTDVNMAQSSSFNRLMFAVLPAIAMGTVFEMFLGHRHDYTGHFLAGYGGTLAACMVWLRPMSPERLAKQGDIHVLALAAICISLGAIAEATIFRIAKFDEVDFCNQSLGAVLAGVVSLKYVSDPPCHTSEFDRGLIAAITFLGVGGCYAFA